MSVPDLTLRIWLGDPIEVPHSTAFLFLNRCLCRPPFISGIRPNQCLKTCTSKTFAMNFRFGSEALITSSTFKFFFLFKYTENSKHLESQKLLCAVILVCIFSVLCTLSLFLVLAEVIGLGDMRFSVDPSASNYLLVVRKQRGSSAFFKEILLVSCPSQKVTGFADFCICNHVLLAHCSKRLPADANAGFSRKQVTTQDECK